MGSYSEEDEENEFGGLDDESPPPESQHNYLSTGLSSMTTSSLRTAMQTGGMTATSQMMPQPHLLQQEI